MPYCSIVNNKIGHFFFYQNHDHAGCPFKALSRLAHEHKWQNTRSTEKFRFGNCCRNNCIYLAFICENCTMYCKIMRKDRVSDQVIGRLIVHQCDWTLHGTNARVSRRRYINRPFLTHFSRNSWMYARKYDQSNNKPRGRTVKRRPMHEEEAWQIESDQ